MAGGCRVVEIGIGMHWGSSRSVLQQNCEIQRGSAGRHIIYIYIRRLKTKDLPSFPRRESPDVVLYVGKVCMMYENC